MPCRTSWLLALAFIAWPLLAQDRDPYVKQIAPASDEAVRAIGRFGMSAGMKAEVFAAEPLLANPVAFCFDEQGRAYVAETFRLHRGVTDNRSHPAKWTDDDLAARTVADRVAFYKKHLGTKFAEYSKHTDRVRLVYDSDGDGRADKATVFADGFNRPEDGLGSGVLAHRGKVWFTNIPDLWLLQDTKNTGRADVKKSLHTGYGVHVAFIGHDLHGLAIGPDGKLYFSIGDRGLHVVAGGRTLSNPDSGAVLRCNPDGSDLEIVATGLRNPQELAFDELGNLFTGDNNADGGDQARWVHVVPGGDSGWRIGYQYLPGLGPWNREQMWRPRSSPSPQPSPHKREREQHDTQPAFLVPPLANFASGPSGLCYHPGVSLLSEKYQRHFFLCDFRGGPGGSAVHAFTLKPKGASFEVGPRESFLSSILATDCDFGPDGGFYVSDWIDGWGLPNKGRLYKFFDPSRTGDPRVREVKQLLAHGVAQKSAEDLATLLEHPDLRVRREAQFTLAERGDQATLTAAAKSGPLLKRVHALWGLGQISVQDAKALASVVAVATDNDTEVRAQALKVLGEGRYAGALPAALAGMKTKEPRVQFYAALAVGRVGKADAVPAVLDLLRANADQDAYVRHAGVMALAGIGDKSALESAALDASPAARLGALLAMRRLELPEIATFLDDADPRLVAEAARAIYDVPISGALPKLAALATKAGAISQGMPAALAEPILRRSAAAQRYLGPDASALTLANLAAHPAVAASVRLEALKLLDQWEQPPGRDPITGLWRPGQARRGEDVATAVKQSLGQLLTGPDAVRTETVRLAAKHGLKDVGPFLRQLALDVSRPEPTRVESLRALHALADPEWRTVAAKAKAGDAVRIRQLARRLLLPKAPDAALRELTPVLEQGATFERQDTFALLGELKNDAADRMLADWLERLRAGQVAPEVQLDLLQAAEKRGTPALKQGLAAVGAARPKDDPLGPWRATLAGGDAERGRALFFDRTELSCLRCHKAGGAGGEVGPDLAGIGKKQKRDYLLEAIALPDRQIAKGFDTVVLALTSGQFKSGILKSENAKEVRLMTPEGQLLTIRAADIDERSRGKSAMPDDLIKKMSPSELRDLIEFLAGL